MYHRKIKVILTCSAPAPTFFCQTFTQNKKEKKIVDTLLKVKAARDSWITKITLR